MSSSIHKLRWIPRLAAAAVLTAVTAGAQAGVISSSSADGPGQDLQSLFDGWVGPGYDVNGQYQTPSYWTIGATGVSAATLIIEIAGNANNNVFGLFDRNDATNRLMVYDGTASATAKRAITYSPGTDAYTVIDLDSPGLVDAKVFSGASFGFYLEGPGGTFFSNPALNSDQVQMVAFQGQGQTASFLGGSAPWLSNEWLLAWEDLPYGSGDQDFNDLVLMIESVTPVPLPGTIPLLAGGLGALVVMRRRRTA